MTTTWALLSVTDLGAHVPPFALMEQKHLLLHEKCRVSFLLLCVSSFAIPSILRRVIKEFYQKINIDDIVVGTFSSSLERGLPD